jgi:ADP-ribose pyrophosphatase YjhB (NUDIX family)
MTNEQKILVSKEKIDNKWYTKFPGGGLEFGEGPTDCLKREFMEEMGQTITILKHFYTTDIFVQSKFNPKKQVLAIYYLISGINGRPQSKNPDEQHLSFISIHSNNKQIFTFETDQKVYDLIVENKFK